MALRNMAYDHPAYIVPVAYSGLIPAGANTVERFLAHADLVAKVARAKRVTGGSSASATIVVAKVSGTTTTPLGTMTMGTAGEIANRSVDLLDAAIAQGDEIRFTSGTDASDVFVVSLEATVRPGANFTA
jgi:hypothetical protein